MRLGLLFLLITVGVVLMGRQLQRRSNTPSLAAHLAQIEQSYVAAQRGKGGTRKAAVVAKAQPKPSQKTYVAVEKSVTEVVPSKSFFQKVKEMMTVSVGGDEGAEASAPKVGKTTTQDPVVAKNAVPAARDSRSMLEILEDLMPLTAAQRQARKERRAEAAKAYAPETVLSFIEGPQKKKKSTKAEDLEAPENLKTKEYAEYMDGLLGEESYQYSLERVSAKVEKKSRPSESTIDIDSY